MGLRMTAPSASQLCKKGRAQREVDRQKSAYVFLHCAGQACMRRVREPLANILLEAARLDTFSCGNSSTKSACAQAAMPCRSVAQ